MAQPGGRLREVGEGDEPPSTSTGRNGNGVGNGRLESRVAVLESELKHPATTADVLGLKIWVLGGVIGGMIVAAGLAIAISRLFLDAPPS